MLMNDVRLPMNLYPCLWACLKTFPYIFATLRLVRAASGLKMDMLEVVASQQDMVGECLGVHPHTHTQPSLPKTLPCHFPKPEISHVVRQNRQKLIEPIWPCSQQENQCVDLADGVELVKTFVEFDILSFIITVVFVVSYSQDVSSQKKHSFLIHAAS